MSIVGENQWSLLSFVQGVRNKDFDAVKSQADFDRRSGITVTGQLVLPSGKPAGKTQVVILPEGRWGNLNLNQKTFANPIDEKCSYANADGRFSVNINAEEYYVAFFHEGGYRVSRGPLKNDATHQLHPWQTVTFTSHGWQDDQKVEIWVRPEGTADPCPGWSMKWITRKDEEVTVKVPVGKGTAVQVYGRDGGIAVAGGNTSLNFQPGKQTTIKLPPLTDKQRAEGKARLKKFLDDRAD